MNQSIKNMYKVMAFCHLQENLDTATKTGIDVAKTASKTVVQKTAEATGDLIGNKKVTSVGKSKKREKEKKMKQMRQKRFIFQPEKRQQIIDDLRSV